MSTNQAALVTATDIVHWAQYYQGRFTLPQLIRRLILASVKEVQRIQIPSEEQVSRSGFDGIVTVKNGNPWVPSGESIWEMGVDGSPKTKADRDYHKRVKERRNFRMNRTFVFVTPRTWQKHEDWCQTKKRKREWKDIKVLDSSELAEWLDSTPAVSRWFARLIGKCPPDAQDITGYWDSVSHSSVPVLPAAAFLAGREKNVSELDGWMKNPAVSAYVECDSPQEMIDFFAAYAVVRRSDQGTVEARSLVIKTPDAWHTLSGSTSPLILLATFAVEPQLVTEAVRHGHHVLCYVPPGGRTGGGVKLRRLLPYELEDVLTATGFDPQRAHRVSFEANGSSTVLRRLIVEGAPKTPDWAQPHTGPKLAAFLLVGGWTPDCSDDRKIVSAITQLTEAEIDAVALQWSRSDDPLFRKTENQWRLVSRIDSWRWLHGYLTQPSADAYSKLFPKVVAVNDPQFDLSPEERVFAPIFGKSTANSRALRQGMIEAFALLSISSEFSSEYPTAPTQVPLYSLFEQVFGKKELTWKRIASIQTNLQLFAEALPDELLGVLERAVNEQPSLFVELFKQEHLFSGTPSVSLLWALEVMAWDSNYTSRVATILATLSRLDPGGNMNPRPLGVLGSLFFPLLPQTTASTEERSEILDVLTQKETNVTWRLLLSLLPKRHGVSFHNAHPRFRNWSMGWSTSARTRIGVKMSSTPSLRESSNLRRIMSVISSNCWNTLRISASHSPRRCRMLFRVYGP